MFKHLYTGSRALAIALFLLSETVFAQTNNMAQPGPKGIFLTLGRNIPCGKPVSSYRIDRRVKDGVWLPLTEVKFPASFPFFKSRLEKAKVLFPSQPLPSESKLQILYDKAAESGIVDSLGKKIQFPLRVALGLMYYDADVKNNDEYQYRVTETKTTGIQPEPILSNVAGMPFTAQFDDIVLVETSREESSAFIKWRSAGTNPSPLFMVFRIENKKAIPANGLTAHYSLNDTTYYTFRDSLGATRQAAELQYFLAPYDLFGNPGKQSQVASITRDNFTKASFFLINISKLTERTGNRISWHFSDPVTSRSIEVFRSEKPDIGFIKVAGLTPADTVYNDERILLDKGYYYYIQANSRNGNRYKQSAKIYTPPCMPVKPSAPLLKSATGIPGGVKLLIEVTESPVGGVRIFRNDGVSESMTAVSGLVPKTASQLIVFIDSSSSLSGRRTYTYAVRTESTGNVVSDLSDTATARPILSITPPPPSFLKAFEEDGKVKLYWEDMKQTDEKITGYTVFRRNETLTKESSLPFYPIAGETPPYGINSLTDSLVVPGTIYTYAVQAVDADKTVSPQKTQATVAFRMTKPVAPFGLTCKNIREGIRLQWIQLSFKGLKSFNLYRYRKGESAILLATLPAASTDYSDATAQPGGQYFYYLTSLNDSGKESKQSGEVGVIAEK